MSVSVNGAQRDLAAGATVADLLTALALQSALVAVEVERVLVPRARHAEHALAAGDRVEIVTLVGGG
ncbi:MAG: sulfur carrier protein ThiS [Planctomycetota bacterium]